jgi:hypothetical protein
VPDDWLPDELLPDVPDEELEPDEPLLPPIAPLLPLLPAPLVPDLAPDELLPPMAPVLPAALLPELVPLELPVLPALPRLAFWSLPRLEPEPFPSFDF